MLDPLTSIATLVLEHSECAAVLARHRIDECREGRLPLADACRSRGLDVIDLVLELETAIARRRPRRVAADPHTLSVREVITQLIAPHHQYLHRTLPAIQRLAAKVAGVHGARRRSLRELAIIVDIFVATTQAHLADEERALFPAVLAGEVERARVLLAEMERDHAEARDLLARLRRAAADYVAPAWACTSYRALLRELETLDDDMHAHFAVEEQVLRPRFVANES